jgi:hypothetical protein
MTLALFWHAVGVYALIAFVSFFGALMVYGVFCTQRGVSLLGSLFTIGFVGLAIYGYFAH